MNICRKNLRREAFGKALRTGSQGAKPPLPELLEILRFFHKNNEKQWGTEGHKNSGVYRGQAPDVQN